MVWTAGYDSLRGVVLDAHDLVVCGLEAVVWFGWYALVFAFVGLGLHLDGVVLAGCYWFGSSC